MMAMTESECKRSAHHADVMRVSLGRISKPQDQRSSSCTRCQLLVMPNPRAAAARQALHRTALLASCAGLLLGLYALERHPLLGSLTVLTAAAGLLLSAVEFLPGPATSQSHEKGDRAWRQTPPLK